MEDTFSLQHIANWQLNPDESLVELPTIQRGFVWKPKQVEDLWDSLLRGYPIGSFLFSQTGQKLYLMDGQQRATSIFLGYFNPFNTTNATKAWAIKGELPVVWIDIKPKSKPVNSKFLIRTVTRSHPWGYQATNNDTKLSVADRNKALNLFKQHPENNTGYTSFKNNTVFPYDCSYPLPLSFFIESANIAELIDKAERHLPEYISTKNGGFNNRHSFIELLKTDISGELYDIFEAVKSTNNLTIKSNIIENRVLNEENDTENPVLFVRINSAGTTLTGDDLIYSIYKSLFPEAKNLIENIGLNFISPTQVLSLVSRIIASDMESKRFVKKMNVRDFQRRIKNEEFKSRLKTLIETGEIEKLFAQAIEILSCKHNSLFDGEIPPVIIKQLIRKNQGELFLFFVYWLHTNQMELTERIQLKMVAKLLVFSWFEFTNFQRLWKRIENVDFWEEPLNRLIWTDDVGGIQFLIAPELLRAYYAQPIIEQMFLESNNNKWGLWKEGVGDQIIQYFNSIKATELDMDIANRYFWKFIGKIQYNRPLILFSQRSYINATFKDYNQIDDMDDTNVPWDWDHIYPDSWVYNMKYCEQIIRDWNGTNGNFRAISLEQNRSESNAVSPKIRLEDATTRELSFVFESDFEHWHKIDDRIWNKEKAIYHFRAITTRMINIYEKFWNDLKINELLSSE
ncbi:MAG: DUF262 domain-containing protein [Paludibacter sp.]